MSIESWIDQAHGEQVRFLAEIVKTPSDNPPGDCAPAAERAAILLEELGFTVERHPVPADLVRANGMLSATNLIVRRRFGEGPTVALNAHGDVVPPGAGWTTDPYGAEIRDGWMYGRGVAVSKSDFATYAYALKALEASGLPLRGTVELHMTYDEEAGGEIGPKYLIEASLSKPDFAICAGFSYQIVTAHNGCLHLEVRIRGKSAHAARPDTGHDALEAATKVLNALYGLRSELAKRHSATPGIETPTLVVGLIHGGINTNVVPDEIVLRLDRRMVPEEDVAAAEQELRRVSGDAVAGLPGIGCEIARILLARPFTPQPGQEKLVHLVSRHASAIMGEPVGPAGVPLYTDARHYSEAGIPTILYGAGPHSMLDANAHRADERLELEDLRKATKVIALALADLLA